MAPDYWQSRWERGETGWHLADINPHLRGCWPDLGVAAGSRVLVPLCGKTRDLGWLAGQGYRVLGVELSPLAAAAFFTEHGLEPTVTPQADRCRYQVDGLEILCGDLFTLTPDDLAAVAAVYDRGALIAFPPAWRARYAAHLDALLPAPVPRLLITLDYDQTRAAGPPFAVSSSEVERLFGTRHQVTALAAVDALPDLPGLRAQGVGEVIERVYRLDPA